MDIDSYNYRCNRTTNVVMKAEFNDSKPHKMKIKFNFSLHHKIKNFILHQNSTTPQQTGASRSWKYDAPPLVMAVGEYLWKDDLREALGEAIGGDDDDDRLCEDEIDQLVDHAWEVVWREFTNTEMLLPTHGLLTLDAKMYVKHHHVYHEHEHDHGMVPAAGASIKSLEKYEVDDDEESCCICLEHLDGGGEASASRMPCSHVFHGGCIEEWLKRSHYCPLCRYEMPTAMEEYID